MEKYFEKLRTHIAENPRDFGDGKSVLTMLYEAYAESNKMDDGTIKEDFNELYRQMNGMELPEIDTFFSTLEHVLTLLYPFSDTFSAGKSYYKSTNNKDRQKNTAGILKNSNALETDPVRWGKGNRPLQKANQRCP